MLVAVMLLPFASHAQTCTGLTLPYAENFDAYTGNATGTTAPTGYPSITLPDCWTFLNMSEGTSAYPQVFLTSSTTYAVSGNCLFFKSSSTTPLYASMPDFGAQSGAWLLSFKYRNEGTTDANGTIIVGVMSDPSDATTFVALDTLDRTTTKTEVELIIPAGSVAAGGRVTFCYLGGTSNNYYAAIDDVALDAPSCFPVSNVVVSDVTANSITLTWTDAVNSGAQYSVFDMSGVNPSVIATLINGTTYTVTGLDANTSYQLGVSANCSETAASTITEIMARTACPATIALPYVEEFNGYTGFQTYPYYGPSVLPACWIYYGNGTNTAETSGTSVYYGGVAQYNGTGYGSMESNNPYLYLPIQLTGANVTSSTYLGYATARGDVRYAVLPAFAESLSGLQMSFDYKMSSSYSATGAAAVLELGYVTNDDVTTFVSMWSANAVNSIQHVVELNLTTLAAAAPAGARLAFKFSGVHNGTGTSSYTNVGCGIDNITVETLPACSRALDVTVAAVTTSSVTLNWHHNDLNAANTTYTVYNMADTTVVATGVNDTTYTVTGLTANTVYNFGVEANCAAGDAAITIVSRRTACAAEALPFSETFDASLSSNPCWAGANILYADGVTPTMGANNNWTYTSTASNGIEAGHYRVNIFGTSCNKWLITPEIDLTTATNPMLTFDAAFTVYTSTSTGPATGFENNDSQKFMVLVSTNNGQTWTVASDIPLTSIASGSYLTQYVSLAAYAGETVRVAFYAQSTVSGGDNNLHIDNIAIDEVVGEICYPTTGLTVSNITATSATVTWNSSTVGNYVLYIMNDSSSFMYTDTVADLNTLQPNTEYTVGVTVDCPSGESPMITTSFRTACSAVEVPYTETFASTSATRDCWTFVSMNTGNDLGTSNGMGFYTVNDREVWRFSSYSNHGGSNDYNQYGYSPVMNNTTTDSLHVKVVYATYNSSNILNFGYIVGADTVWAPADFTTTGSSDWQTFEANLPYNTTQLAVHYYGNYSYYAWIDSVEVTVATAGGDTTVVADSVHITYAVNDATMGTTNPAPGTYTYVEGEAFSVTAVPATGYHLTDWQMTIDVPDYGIYSMMMGTDTLTLSDTASANYDGLILTAIFAADGGDTTVVECDPVAIPFVETFETTSATADCWTTDGPGIWTIATGDYSAATGAYEGSLNASITHGTTGDVTKFISPVLSGVTNGMQLQFAHIQRSWAGDIDNLAVYYRTSSDATWQQLAAYTNEVAAWTVETINIPGTVYQVAFEYTDHYGYGVGVDSIAFNLPPASLPVVNLTASNITATGATLSWTGSAASYNVYSIDATGTATLVQNVTVDSIDLTGLTAMTAYTYGVRAVCGTDESEMTTVTFATACGGETCNIEINGADSYGDGWNGNAIQVMQAGNVIATFTLESGSSASAQIPVCSGYPVSFAWVLGNYPSETSFEIKDGAGMVVYSESGSNLTGGEVFYTMNDACPSCIPAAITVDTATTTSVTISWTGTAASYDVYNGTTLVTNTTTNTYTFTGLNPATTYTFGVQAICSATDTAALATITVMTACADITTLPYMEGFENGLGCWSTVNGSSDGMPWFTTNSSSSLIAHSGNAMAVSVSYYSGAMHANAWLISPKFILPTIGTGDTLNLSWWHKVSSNYPTELYDVMLSTTTDDTAAFTTTLLAVNPDSTSDWVNKVVDMSAYAGQSVYIAFHHHDSYDQNYLLIDDISLSVGAAPVPPADTLTVTFAVNDATMGTTVPAPGTYQYLEGDTVYFGSSANPGYHFLMWEVTIGSDVDTFDATYSNGYYILADNLMGESPVIFKAFFEVGNPDSMQVTIAVNDPTMGTTNPAPGVHYYYADQMASLVAIPNPGNHLEGWAYSVTIPGYGTQADPIPFAIDDFFEAFLDGEVLPASFCQYEWTVTALFAAGEPPVMHDSVTVNVSVNNETMGVVTPAPGTHYYVLGDTVIMSIMPNPGYRVVAVQMSATHPIMGTLFDETITDSLELAELVGVNDTLIVEDEEMYGMVLNINVVFAAEGAEPTTYSVEVAYDQTKGTVTGAGDYVEGSNVRLVAMPATHYEFYAWLDNNTGDTVSRESVYAIANIDRDYFLTAIFVASTGIDDVDMDNVTIYSTDNVIVVRGAEGKQVTLFDVNGRMLSREARAAEQVEFRVNNSGVYLVKVANAAAKRVVVIR